LLELIIDKGISINFPPYLRFMRNLILPLSIVLSLFFASCGQSGDSSVAEEAEVVNDLPAVLVNGTNELDLSEYFILKQVMVKLSSRLAQHSI